MSEDEQIALALFLVLIGIIVIVVHIRVSLFFAEIAEQKGHSKKNFFWCVFFLGIVGMLMVIALPNIKAAENTQKETKNNIPSSLREVKTRTVHPQVNEPNDVNKGNPPVSAEISNGEKVCPKCGQSQRANRKVCWSCGQHFDN